MAAPAHARTSSVHSLQLDEEEQLQIALALSSEDAALAKGSAAAAEHDERLARELQEAEYAEAARRQQGQGAPAPTPSPAATPAGAGAGVAAASSAGGSTSAGVGALGGRGGGKLADSIRQASSGAVQRISSGSSQLWQGLKRVVDPQQQQQQQQPYYQPPPAYHPHQQPQAYQQPARAHHAPAHTPAPAPHPDHRSPSWQPPQQQLSEDEALALALQRQFDLEEQQLWQQQQHQEQRQQQRQQPAAPVATGPLGANLAATTAAAAAAAGRPPAGAPPSAAAAPPASPAPAAAPAALSPAPAAAPAAAQYDRRRCGGCGGSLFGMLGARSPHISALGRNWHLGCLVCAGCHRPIGDRGGVPFCEREGRLYHLDCHRAKFHPKCDVCGDYCPEEAHRRIVWSEVAFWRQRFCPHHIHDGTPRCASCERLRPHAQADTWAELEDGRQVCLPCLGTITTDTRDAQPLWHNVLSFYVGMGMPLPVVPPMMLVDSGALNEAEGQETRGKGRGAGPVFHVRGLTLTEEYSLIRSILRIPGGNPFAIQREAVRVGPTHCEVTGILVLYGLPRLLTGSILAHECMHAWLRMSGCSSHQHLPEQVEEGLCQLMAYLWLEGQQAQTGFQDEYEERLAAFFAHQIRSDTSAIYGDGFRLAHEAFQAQGLPAVLAHVQRLGAFPPA